MTEKESSIEEELELEEPEEIEKSEKSEKKHKKKKKHSKHRRREKGKKEGQEEEEEEEEDEDDNDHYEVDGFVVEDNFEEDEPEDIEKIEGDESEKKKRTKKKKRKHLKLDEDDFTLMKDAGINVPSEKSTNRKRLRKGIESDQIDTEEFQKTMEDQLFGNDEDDDLDERDKEDREEQSNREKENNIDDDELSEGEESDGLDDFIVDTDENGVPIKRAKRPKRRKNRMAASSGQMRDAAEIFGIGYEDFMNEENEQPKPTQKTKLEDQFEPAILSERYMTVQDDVIRSIDIPERLQPRYSDQEKASAVELTSEATWIYQQLFEGGQLDKKLISRIINVLEFLRNDHLEVPYIQRYCDDYVNPPNRGGPTQSKDLQASDLWNIYDLDEKWTHFTARKSLLEQFYEREGFDHKYVELLKDTQSELELQDLFEHFQLHSKKDDERTEESERKQKRAIRRDHYRMCKRSGIIKFVSNFGITAAQLGENMENDTTVVPTDPDRTPQELAEIFDCEEDVLGKKRETRVETLLSFARSAAAQEIALEPQIRKVLRAVYYERATISTYPTEKGKALDAFHPMRGTVRIEQKPAKLLMAAVQWLEILKAEKDGFLTIKIQCIPSKSEYQSADSETFFSKDMETLYLSDGTSENAQSWNDQRKLILHEAISKFLLPSLEKELRQKLYEESSKCLTTLCAEKLTEKLSMGPFQPVGSENNDLEDELKVMACCYGQGDVPTMCIIIDSHGQASSYLKLKYITTKGDTRREDELIKLQEFIIDHEPHVVAVASDVDSRKLYDELNEVVQSLHRDRKISETPLTWVEPDVAQLFQTSERANAEFPDYPEIAKRAVSIGRFLIDPLTELCYLAGNESKEILYLKLHPLQNLVDKEKLLQTLIRCFLGMTNKAGVDINKAVQYKFASYNLQFVAGLGPRKAVGIISAISRKGGKIGSREELEGIVGPCVFTNCAGFIRIREKYTRNVDSNINVLDDTRIHPSDYNLVRKMAKDALEEDTMDDDLVEKLMKKPQRLDDIDLVEFAEELEKNNKPKKRSILELIKQEINDPFGGARDEYRPVEYKNIKHYLTGSNENPLRVGQIVSAKIVSVSDRFVRCRLDNGITGIIKENNISSTKNIKDLNLQEGMVLNARVLSIDEDKNLVDLSSQSHILADPTYENNQLDYLSQRDPYFRREDYSHERSKTTQKKKKGFTKRRIEHPLFQNIGFQESEDILRQGSNGETILRPSSKGQNCLTLSVKFFDDIFLHITVREEQKPNSTTIGKFLWIGTQKFEAIDEIISNYVEPMIDFAEEMFKFRVFRKKTPKEEVEQLLKEEKRSQPSRIPYFITASTDYPGKFILSYLPSKSPRHEYVSVNDNGFKFRGNIFKTPEKLITWFKVHWNDPLPKEKVHETRTDANASHYKPNNLPPYPPQYINQEPSYSQNWYQQQNNFAQRPPVSSYNNNRDYRGPRSHQNDNSNWNESWTSNEWNQAPQPQVNWNDQPPSRNDNDWPDAAPHFPQSQAGKQAGWD